MFDHLLRLQGRLVVRRLDDIAFVIMKAHSCLVIGHWDVAVALYHFAVSVRNFASLQLCLCANYLALACRRPVAVARYRFVTLGMYTGPVIYMPGCVCVSVSVVACTWAWVCGERRTTHDLSAPFTMWFALLCGTGPLCNVTSFGTSGGVSKHATGGGNCWSQWRL